METTLDDIMKFHSKCNKMKYLLVKNGRPIYDDQISGSDYFNYYKGLSPQEFEKYGGGVCWDYVVYQATYFRKHFSDVPFETFFFCLIDEDGDLPSHTVLLFYLDGYAYWFESAWKSEAKLRQFKSRDDALNRILNLLLENPESADRTKSKILGHAVKQYNPFDRELIGLGCGQYYEYMNKQTDAQFKRNKKAKEIAIIYDSNIYESFINYCNMMVIR